MTMFLAPYTAIADVDGSPLDAGFLYLGEYGKDPVGFPVEVFWDADFTVPAAQPIRTRNGYPVRNGSPAKVYLKTAQHSIAIKNRKGAFVLVDFYNKGWDASFVVDASGKNQQQINSLANKKLSTTYDIDDASNYDRRLLSDVFATLAEAKLVYPFVSDLSGSLGWAVLQKQMNGLDANTAAKKVMAGSYFVNKTLKYEAKSTVEFDLKLKLSGGSIGQYAIEFNNTDVSKLTGKIDLTCDVTDSYTTHNWAIRSWWDGCLFKRVTATDSSSLLINGRLKGQLVDMVGVINNGNYAAFGMISGTCGSRSGDWTATITAVSNIGTADSLTQTAELTLSTALPPQVVGHVAKIGTDYHYIRAVSENKITVEVWVNPVNTQLDVIYGGIAKSNGDNANGISFKLLRGFRSAVTYSCATAMGVLVSTFGSEYNEISVTAGAGYDTNLSYLDIDQWYSEHNAIDIFDTRTGVPHFEFLRIKSDVGLGLANWASNVLDLLRKSLLQVHPVYQCSD